MIGQKHHDIPKFYLKQWTGSDHQLCGYSRPYRKVVAQRKHRGGTGFSRGLYTIAGAPPNLAYVSSAAIEAAIAISRWRFFESFGAGVTAEAGELYDGEVLHAATIPCLHGELA